MFFLKSNTFTFWTNVCITVVDIYSKAYIYSSRPVVVYIIGPVYITVTGIYSRPVYNTVVGIIF